MQQEHLGSALGSDLFCLHSVGDFSVLAYTLRRPVSGLKRHTYLDVYNYINTKKQLSALLTTRP